MEAPRNFYQSNRRRAAGDAEARSAPSRVRHEISRTNGRIKSANYDADAGAEQIPDESRAQVQIRQVFSEVGLLLLLLFIEGLLREKSRNQLMPATLSSRPCVCVTQQLELLLALLLVQDEVLLSVCLFHKLLFLISMLSVGAGACPSASNGSLRVCLCLFEVIRLIGVGAGCL